VDLTTKNKINAQRKSPRAIKNVSILGATFISVAMLSSYTASKIKVANATAPIESSSALLSTLDQPEMVLIPAGVVGTTEPFPTVETVNDTHTITIAKPFYMSKYEITFSQWDECVEHGGCSHVPDDKRWGRDKQPVIDVSWVDIQQYLSWLSQSTGKEFRLPTEREWEYAARAGSSEHFGPPPLFTDPKLAWASNYVLAPVQPLKTQPVDAGEANAYGLFGIRGNVWEWTETCFQSNGQSKDQSDMESCGIRILRGEHRSYMPNFLREIGTGGCAVKPLPGNFGFRVVSPFVATSNHSS